MLIPQMKEKLKTMLTPCRYQHSIGVMETAVKLARLNHADEQKALIAGLLHDCAKDMTLEKMLAMCSQLSVRIDDETRSLPKKQQPCLIHALLGAGLAKAIFGIHDAEILDAIRYHTLGRPQMTVLDEIIYLSDGIEPNRKPYEGLADLRELCYENLDAAMLQSVSMTIEHNQEKGRMLHSQTIQTKIYFESLRCPVS